MSGKTADPQNEATGPSKSVWSRTICGGGFMSWLNAIGDLAERYAANSNQASTENTHEDFQQVVEAAPRDVVRHGIANMFRSDQTPPFPEMVSNLFSQSNQNQKTGLLNQ